MDDSPPAVYRLGEFTLAPESRALERAGEPVRLARLPFAVLVYLVEHRDRVVPRAELLDRFWDGKEVYEDSLRTCIGTIRGALGDSPSAPRFVETRHRQGYRYVGPFEEAAPAPVLEVETTRGVSIVLERDAAPAGAAASALTVTAPRLSRRAAARLAAVVLAGAALAAVAFRPSPAPPAARVEAAPLPPAVRSIAVLPLRNLTGDPGDEFLSDGITESLISDLSRVGALKVISRGSSFALKGEALDPREVGRRLGVEALLEGGLRRSGARVRLEVRLVSTEDGRVLWAADADERAAGDPLEVQDAVECRVASELRVRLCGEGERVARRYTQNADAYREYLKGRLAWNRRSPADLREAVGHFERAVAADPSYALAYAGLAETYAVMEANSAVPPGSVLAKGEAAARRALEMDETLPGAWAALGLLRNCACEWDEGERFLRHALELNPNYGTARMWLANGAPLVRGRFDEAEAELRRAWETDPLSGAIAVNLAELYIFSRQYDRAVAQGLAATELNPESEGAWWAVAMAQLALGRGDEAVAAASHVANEGARHWLAVHVAGRRDEERRMADEFAASRPGAQNPYVVATLYARLGDADAAVRWLERACDARQGERSKLAIAPELDCVRAHPRYPELLRRVGLAPG